MSDEFKLSHEEGLKVQYPGTVFEGRGPNGSFFFSWYCVTCGEGGEANSREAAFLSLQEHVKNCSAKKVYVGKDKEEIAMVKEFNEAIEKKPDGYVAVNPKQEVRHYTYSTTEEMCQKRMCGVFFDEKKLAVILRNKVKRGWVIRPVYFDFCGEFTEK